MKILVTGAAGFIGFHTSKWLLDRGETVVGLDNLNAYYDPALKNSRLQILSAQKTFRFAKVDIVDRKEVERLFSEVKFDRVIHLAAQAGVRYSIRNPQAYGETNLIGFLNVLECCRHHAIEHLVYASTSSVYGANTKMPFSVDQNVDHPLTLYAATKKANELMAHSYSSLYKIPTTGLRFFSVYGPWGRPDMALFLFTKNILQGKSIDVYNNGRHRRDFTFIDDIVGGVVAAMDHVAAPNASWNSAHPEPSTSSAPYRVYNIGNEHPIELLKYIELIEQFLGMKANLNLLPLQPGDVADSWADIGSLEADVGYRPKVPVEVGVRHFVEWYVKYYRVSIPRQI
jgi:UDP-glucuronate 4-epimerase